METTQKLWDKNRILKTEMVCDNGLLSKFRWFSDAKKIRYEVSYVNWQLHGIEKGWYKNGKQEYEITYIYGIKQGSEKQWYENGLPKYEVSWLGHIKHGLERKWYANGQIEFEISYKNGVFHGINKKWYENGNKKSEYPYINGQSHGLEKEWYVDGEIHFETLCRDGIQHGLTKGVIRNKAGKTIKRFENPYDNGQIHGIAKDYDGMNNLIEEKAYFRGVKIPKDIYFYPERIKVEQIITESNVEVRRIMLELMGYEKFLTQMPHRVVHKDGEYALIRIYWHKQEESIMLVKVKCSSSGAWYTLRVPPNMKTCKEALAWTFNVSPEEYVLEEEA